MKFLSQPHSFALDHYKDGAQHFVREREMQRDWMRARPPAAPVSISHGDMRTIEEVPVEKAPPPRARGLFIAATRKPPLLVSAA